MIENVSSPVPTSPCVFSIVHYALFACGIGFA